MGQKVHPLGFRLGITRNHYSQWFAKPKDYPELIIEDHFLRQKIVQKFPEAGIVSITIQRKVDQVQIEICAARPRILVTFGGQNLEQLKQYLLNSLRTLSDKGASGNPDLAKSRIKLAVSIVKVTNPTHNNAKEVESSRYEQNVHTLILQLCRILSFPV